MRVTIQNPCDADWNKMTKAEGQRHCELCKKNVIDFREQSRKEIFAYLQKDSNSSSTCGRFYAHQLDNVRMLDLITIETLKQLPSSKVLSILVVLCLVLTSCDELQPNLPTTGKISVEHAVDTQATNPLVVDSTDVFLNLDTADHDTDTQLQIIETMGEVYIEDTLIFNHEYEEPEIIEPTEPTMGIVEIDVCVQFPETQAEFPDGPEALKAFVLDNFKTPIRDSDLGKEAKLYINFKVQKDGSLTKVKVVRSDKGAEAYEAEAIRVVKAMPNWIPAENDGKVVISSYILPIKIRL